MKRRIAINGRDKASFDQNGAIKLHPSDQQSKVEVSPRVVHVLCVKRRVV